MTKLSNIENMQKRIHKIYSEIEIRLFPMVRPMFNEIKGKNLIGAEIGVNEGKNAYRILKNLDIKLLYLIDPYPIDFVDKKLHYSDGEIRYLRAKGLLSEFDNKMFLRCTVNDVILPMLDFAYIDGDHSYEATMNDLSMLYPIIKEGGIIGGDNFDVNWIGVPFAVVDFAREHNLEIKGIRNQWWFNVK